MSRHTTHEGSSFRRRALALAALTSIAACGSENISGWDTEQVEDGADQVGALDYMPRAVIQRASKKRARGMTPELEAVYISTIQRDAPASYHASILGTDGFQLRNQAQGFVGKLNPAGVQVESFDASWTMSLQTTGYGCEGAAIAVGEAKVESEGNRVRYVRPGIEEWYLNGTLGLEQGFVLDSSLGCAGPKVIEMKTSGELHPELVDADGDGRGDTVNLASGDGSSGLVVSHLYVSDADGKQVPAWMTVKANTMSIHVDDVNAKYPLTVDPLIAVLQQKIPDPEGGIAAQFGYGLALSGDTVIAGAAKANDAGSADAGAAYVFVRNGSVWSLQQKLVPNDPQPGVDRWFGFSIGMSGERVVITAPYDAEKGPYAGAAYIFERSGGFWTQKIKLTASDGKTGDIFGVSAAIDGNRVVVGAHGWDNLPFGLSETGAAYVFDYDSAGNVWNQSQRLAPNDPSSMDLFGATVVLSGNTIAVGSVYDDDKGAQSGSLYMFDRNSTGSWIQQQKLLAPDGAAGDLFSYWAAISSDLMVVSAATHDHGGVVDTGAAYMYQRVAGSWIFQEELLRPAWPQPTPVPQPYLTNLTAGDYFGSFVAIEGNAAVIGAQQTDQLGFNAGSAYWFRRNGAAWSPRDELLPSPGAPNENFGWTTAISGDTVAVGAPFGVPQPATAPLPPLPQVPGSVYIFVERKTNGEPCVVDTECASGFCVDGVCCDTACGGGETDDCQACAKDAGSPGVDGTCTVLTATTTCRDAAGDCDVADLCNGTDTFCPTDVKKTNDVICRPIAAGSLCDVAEACDGVTNDCPTDTFVAAGTVCRPGVAGGCDIEEACTGTSADCPGDTVAPTGTVCRTAQGVCDFEEICNGVSNQCPTDAKKPSSFECGPSKGKCDPSEFCDGTSNDCPADQKSPKDAECNPSKGPCDIAELCDGTSDACPADTKHPIDYPCRPANADELCDATEVCDGTNDACPPDILRPANFPCRAAEGLCDVAELCDGMSKKCPDDSIRPQGVDCRPQADGRACDAVEQCDGMSKDCPQDLPKPAGSNCRPIAGLCDEPEVCNGTSFDCPPDVKTPKGVICRNLQTDGIGGDGDGACDRQEFCDGLSVNCPVNQFAPAGTLCRTVEGACDVQEVCSGAGPDCPSDKVRAKGEICGDPQGGICDLADSCDGKSKTCVDLKVPSTVPCRAAGANPDIDAECDVAEFCGSTDDCPEDEWARNGTTCSIGRCQNGICTVDEVSLYGGGPLCTAAPAGSSSSSSRWSIAFIAAAIGALRRRVRSSRS